jgi:hypothetical protein
VKEVSCGTGVDVGPMTYGGNSRLTRRPPGDLSRVPQDSGNPVGRSRGETRKIADQLGHAHVSLTEDF